MDNLVNNRIAVIPARGGSKRLPKKNILDFLGKPLIAWTIEAALKSDLFDEVIVSTDSEAIAKVSVEFGAKVPFLRKSKADDFSTVSEATLVTLQQLKEEFNIVGKTIIQLMANCPLRNAEDIIKQVHHFEDRKEKISVLSGFKYGMFNPWWAHYIDKDGKYKKLIEDKNIAIRSQDLPELICPTGATWISSYEQLLFHQTFYSPGYTFFELNWKNAIDIDDNQDFELAKAAKLIMNEGI